MLAGWGVLIAALSAFTLTHSVPALPVVRVRLVAGLGRRTYLLIYSCVSVGLLAWLIAAVARAPYLELWPRQDWQAFVPVVGMFLATVLLVFGLAASNPLSLGVSWRKPFDPDRPGIVGLVRHPILWATLLWSSSHVIPNGDLSHVLMFGLFAAISVGGMLAIDSRLRRRLGEAAWAGLARRTANIPLLGLGRGWRPRPTADTAAKLGIGVALYALLLVSHGLVTGVPVGL
jgi:uncharacterized membrane protein